MNVIFITFGVLLFVFWTYLFIRTIVAGIQKIRMRKSQVKLMELRLNHQIRDMERVYPKYPWKGYPYYLGTFHDENVWEYMQGENGNIVGVTNGGKKKEMEDSR